LELHKDEPDVLSSDCVDPLGRSAIIMAIENENYELIQLLLHHNVKVKVSSKRNVELGILRLTPTKSTY